MHTALIFINAILLELPFDYGNMFVYIDKAYLKITATDDILTDLLAICSTVNLPVYIVLLQSQLPRPGHKAPALPPKDGNAQDVNVYMLRSPASFALLETIQTQLYVNDDNLFVLAFDDVDDVLVWRTLHAYRGMYRALFLSPTEVRSANCFSSGHRHTRLLRNVPALWANDIDAIREYGELNLWEDDSRFGVNLHQLPLVVFMSVRPYLTQVDGNRQPAAITGPDAFVAGEVIVGLNATAFVCTDVLLSELGQSLTAPTYPTKYAIDATVSGSMPIANLTYNADEETVDLYMSTMPMHMDDGEEHNAHLAYIYPHTTSCWYFMVPERLRSRSLLQRLFDECRIVVWYCCCWLVVRGLTQFTGVRVESVWRTINGWHALCGGMIMISILYRLLTVKVHNVFVQNRQHDNELLEQLTIMAPDELDFWLVPLHLRSRMLYAESEILWKTLQSDYNNPGVTANVGFVIEQFSVEYCMDHFSSRYRIIVDPMFCGLSAFRVPRNSPFIKSTNQIVSIMLEAGLYEQHYLWSRYLRQPQSDGIASTGTKSTKLFVRVHTYSLNAATELLCAFGGCLIVSGLVFVFELCLWWHRRRVYVRRLADRRSRFPFVL